VFIQDYVAAVVLLADEVPTVIRPLTLGEAAVADDPAVMMEEVWGPSGVGHGWAQTAERPLDRRSVDDGAVNIVSSLHLHKGLLRANEIMLATVPHGAVSYVGFLWGEAAAAALVGFCGGRSRCDQVGGRDPQVLL
jgi:hypothetical protein